MRKAKQSRPARVSCDACPAMCCRYVATEIDAPTTQREYDNVRWYLMHRDVYVFIDVDDDWYLEFSTPCDNLDADNRCAIYANRPRICRDHGDNDDVVCEFHSDDEPHKIRFKNAAQFETWLDAQGT